MHLPRGLLLKEAWAINKIEYIFINFLTASSKVTVWLLHILSRFFQSFGCVKCLLSPPHAVIPSANSYVTYCSRSRYAPNLEVWNTSNILGAAKQWCLKLKATRMETIQAILLQPSLLLQVTPMAPSGFLFYQYGTDWASVEKFMAVSCHSVNLASYEKFPSMCIIRYSVVILCFIGS